MQRQPFVHESVIRCQQIRDAAVFTNNTFDEELHLLLEGFAQRVIEIGELHGIGIDVVDVPHFQPLKREVCHQRFRFRIREQPFHLLIENFRIGQFSFRRGIEKLFVRQPAPEEERQTRRQIDIVDAIRILREMLGNGFSAIQELRARKNRRQRVSNARIEIFVLPGRFIKGHRRCEIVVCYRPAICAARERRDDLFRAFGFFVGCDGRGRPADKNPMAARRVATRDGPGSIIGANNFYCSDCGNAIDAFARHE